MAGYQAPVIAFIGSWTLGSLAAGNIQGGLFSTVPFFTTLLINNWVIGSSKFDSDRLRKLTCSIILGVFSLSMLGVFFFLDIDAGRILLVSLLILGLASFLAFLSRLSIDNYFAEKGLRDELLARIQKSLVRMNLSNGSPIEKNVYAQRLHQMNTHLGIVSLSVRQKAVFKTVEGELKQIEKWLRAHS